MIYRFKKDWEFEGGKIQAGVGFKGPYKIEDNCVSVVGSPFLVNIPLDVLEEYTAPVFKKERRAKTKTKVKKYENKRSKN